MHLRAVTNRKPLNSGRAAGYCAGCPVPGYMNPVPRYGFDRSWGRGFVRSPGFWGSRGWVGYRSAPYGSPCRVPSVYYPAPYGVSPIPEQEMEALKGKAEYFEDVLEEIKKRIQELEAEKEQN